MTMNHFSEEQIDAALLGELASEAAAHLAGCEACSARVAEARLPLAAFQAMSVAWSERRSATMPAVDVQASRFGLGPVRAAWGAAMAAVLALAIAVPAMREWNEAAEQARGHVPQQTVAAVETASGPMGISGTTGTVFNAEQEQISRDNQMLQTIDRELDATSGSPTALGLEPVRGHAGGRAVQVQD